MQLAYTETSRKMLFKMCAKEMKEFQETKTELSLPGSGSVHA